MKPKKVKNPLTVSDCVYNEFADNFSLYLDQRHVPFVVARNSTQIIRTGKSELGATIRNLHFAKGGGTLSAKSVSDAYATIMAQLQVCHDQRTVVQRIHSNKGTIYYVLGDRIAKISNAGATIVRKTQVDFFIESDGLVEQSLPELNTPPDQLPTLLRRFFQLTTEQEVLLLSYIISCFVPQINHPILWLHGEQGAAKSTTLRFIKQLIDPNKKDLFAMPRQEDDLFSVLSNNYFVPLDNISHFSGRLSDILCQSATHGSVSKRKLYTDNQEAVVELHSIVAISGIEMSITRSDLLDRSITVQLARIPDHMRKTEQEIWQCFHAYKPKILGAIFNTLCRAMKMVEQTKLPSQFRMADFALWGYCIAEAIYENGGERFLNAYRENIRVSTSHFVGSNSLVFAVSLLMQRQPSWKGSSTELLVTLRNLLFENSLMDKLPYDFPVNAIQLSKKLSLHNSDLKILGVTVDIGRGKERYILLERRGTNNEQ
ncbi:MAG: hypothetical protein J1E00_02425 [Oscillospiraceae bacterium]|nr:hypothetical protein [Oscillospiraceae bacterium]